MKSDYKELKYNEVRIGNFLYEVGDGEQDPALAEISIKELLGGDEYRFHIRTDNDYLIGSDFLAPMIITEELLVRLGFNKHESIESYDMVIHKPGHNDTYIFRVMKVDSGWWFIVDENKGTERGGLNFGIYNYVHEVQNMYFMLSKEELELKKSIKN